MNFLKDFCLIRTLEKSDLGFRAVVELLPDHPLYRGHFPDQPVVPGVCTLALIRACASGVTGRTLTYAEIRECKFIAALLPAEGLEITLDFSLRENGEISGSVKRGPDTVLKLKAALQ